jgi:pSer/pThr/pTyr-binding forkhead associated (FHA) protein
MPSESSASNANAPALRPLGSHARSPALPLTRLMTLIGSDTRCHLNLISSTVSRQHALIVSSGGRAYVRDLVSRTKVMVNHQAVREAELKANDEIQIGKFAFAFVPAPVEPGAAAEAAPAGLSISDRAEPEAISGLTVLIGRDHDCDVSLGQPEVSARHAVIFQIDGKRYVRDLNSRTGTFLNGSRVRQQEILFGDQIRIGNTRLELVASKEAVAVIKAAAAPKIARPAAPPVVAPRPVVVAPVEEPAVVEEALLHVDVDELAPADTSHIEAPVVADVEAPKAGRFAVPPLKVAEAPVSEPEPEVEAPIEIETPVVSHVEAAEPIHVEEEIPLAPVELEAEPEAEAPVEIEAPVVSHVEPAAEPVHVEEEIPLAPVELEAEPAVVSEAPVEEPMQATVHEDVLPVETEPAESAEPPPVQEEVEATIPVDLTPVEFEEAPAAAEEPAEEPAEARIPGLNLSVEDFPDIAEAGGEQQQAPAADQIADEVLEAPAANQEATLDLDAVLVSPTDGVVEEPAAQASDTEFGKFVEQFGGENAGPLVEETAVVSEIESPAVSAVEPLAVSEVEPPEVVKAEPPVVSEVELPVDAPPAPPVAPVRRVISKSNNSFSLDDGFFSADLASQGIFVRPRTSPTGKLPTTAPAIITPGEPAVPAPSVDVKKDIQPAESGDLGWNTPTEPLNAENLLGGMPVNLAQPKPPPRNAGRVAVAFDAKAPEAGKPKGGAPKQSGGVEIPQPPPKARRRRATPFATKSMGISQDDDGPPAPPAGGASGMRGLSTPFDGLAMPARDVFSNFETTALNDAAFGGVRLSRGDDYVLPESPESAERLSKNPDEDFAESDFWNRTDEEEGLPPMGVPKPPPEVEVPAPQEPEARGVSEVEPPADAAPPKEEALEELLGEKPAPMPGADEGPVLPVEEEHKPAAVADVDASIQKIDSEETWADVPVASPAAVEEPTPVEEIPPSPPPAPPPRAVAARRASRTRILPILMLTMLVCMGLVLAGIWLLFHAKSQVVGTVTFLNYEWEPGTEDGSAFEAGQRRILENEATHSHAREILAQRDPGTSAGFLDVDSAGYLQVISGVKLSSEQVSGEPQTMMQLSLGGTDKTRDAQRMGALLQAVVDANAPALDDNRRIRQIALAAKQEVDDANQRISDIKAELPSLQRAIDQDPDQTEFASLSVKKDDLQKARFAAEDQLDQDRMELERLQAAPSQAAADPPQNPPAPDAQLEGLRQQMIALNQQLQEAKSQQSAGVADARTKLEAAVQQFNDQLSGSDSVLDSSSQLRQFVDSAKDSQQKTMDMISAMIVDGEDLQRQLEDTRRDVEEMIQTAQQEKWAGDTQLQQLQQQLDDAQHRYNAAVGEGVQDQQLLNSLKSEINNLTGQVNDRKNELGVDPSEVKVADGLNKLIDSLKRRLQREKDQIDQVLDPLAKELADLDPQVAGLPEAQQDLARQLRGSLGALNDARKNYADALGEGDAAPSATVTNLEKQLDDLKARFDRRQADLAQQRPGANATEITSAQQRFEADKAGLEDLRKQYETVRVQYDQEAGQHEDAENARAQMAELNEELNNRQSQLEVAVRDRDQKQLQADQCFDIKPLTDADVVGTSIDPRPLFSLYAMGSLAVLFTILTIVASRRAGERRPGRSATTVKVEARRTEEEDDDRHILPA